MKKQFEKEYYLGIDIGTASVGWAVTDTEYNIPKIKGKQLCGVRLFDEAKTAAERRIFRSSKRRLERKNEPFSLFWTLFREHILELYSISINSFQS